MDYFLTLLVVYVGSGMTAMACLTALAIFFIWAFDWEPKGHIGIAIIMASCIIAIGTTLGWVVF